MNIFKIFRKILAFCICSIALILPWRLRCLFSEMIGWVVQFFYLTYIGILKYIVKELEQEQSREK